MRRFFTIFLISLLFLTFIGCGSTATSLPPPSAPTYPQLASVYQGSLFSGITRQVGQFGLQVANEQSDGTFTGQITLGQIGGLVYQCHGSIQPGGAIMFSTSDAPNLLVFTGNLLSTGSMQGTVQLLANDPGSTWILKPTSA